MRIAIAEIAQETATFSSLKTEMSAFEGNGLYFGNELLEKIQGTGPLGGFFEIATGQPKPPELIPIVRGWASAGGVMSAETIRPLVSRLTTGLKENGPFDAVFLSLHGAASSEIDDDVEGMILEKVREIVGPDLPVVVPLDHHANVTERMAKLATVLIGHETQPHHPYETGKKAAKVMFQILSGELIPQLAWRKIPMLTPQDQFLTSQGPMKEWFDLARQMEQNPEVIDVSPYPMQPWLDVAEGGWAVVVHTNGNPDLAEQLADEMAQKAWDLRDQFWQSERVAPKEAVRQADQFEEGLVLLSDTGDSVYGGAPGDSTCILKSLIAENLVGPALVPMVDPEVVQQALEAGVSSKITVSIGGKQDSVFSTPVEITAKVQAVSKGVTVILGERGPCEIGPAVWLQVGPIQLVVLARRTFAINHPVLYTHLGMDVESAKMVVLKTASNFQFFERWRKSMIRVDSPGVTQSNLRAFDWKHVPRPIYPLDEMNNWN